MSLAQVQLHLILPIYSPNPRSIIVDYVPNKKHPTARKASEWTLRLATLVVGIGFYEFETNDVGLIEGVKRIWKAGSIAKSS